MEELRRAVKEASQKLFSMELEPEITRPDEKFGDYATNAALQLAKQAAATPRQIAEKLAIQLQDLPGMREISIAGAGFINFKLTDEALAEAAFSANELPKLNEGKEILVEFGDPNPFKEMHIGHLYSYIVGDAISSLLEASGITVRRLSYHGDVGLHVAKAVWGMRRHPEEIGVSYAAGAKAYEEDEAARAEIEQINQHVYAQDDPSINELHSQGIQLSFEYFDKILNMLSISNDRRYLESQAVKPGKELVETNTGKVFKQSQGAIVFEGEKVGLHTRVFITSKGLPTYETKDLGLVILKDHDYPNAERSIVITANEQSEYFKVMLAALAEIDPSLAAKTTHIAHGFVNLSTGKMSSRTGDVYAAEELINEVEQAAKGQFPDSDGHNHTALAALKYDFLKPRLGGNITFDVRESVNLEGNSGPYLQYAHARACSILTKVQTRNHPEADTWQFDKAERRLARKIGEYPEVIDKAVNELMPHHICTYLYELAQTFNQFYEQSRVVGDEREAIRLQLVQSYADVLKNGLNLLNIASPEKM
ncbi:arginine--tRNA ligase [Candidatus Saccharibacteria bacterium]|nr:arginine--tRNA ligase [Candidatus Saccharibacteria bacterium]